MRARINSVSPGPEDALGRPCAEEFAHLAGEVIETVPNRCGAEEDREKVAGQDAFAVPHQVGDAADEERPWRTEPREDKDVLEAMGSNRRGPLAGALDRSEVLPHQRLDLCVRDRVARAPVVRAACRRCGRSSARAAPGSNMSYTAWATGASSVQWNDKPDVITRYGPGGAVERSSAKA